MAMKTLSGIDEDPREAAARAVVGWPARVQDTPVVNDQNVASPPCVDVWRGECQPAFCKTERGPTALVDCFEAAGIISEKGTIRRKDRRVKRAPAGPDEDRRAFEELKLLG